MSKYVFILSIFLSPLLLNNALQAVCWTKIECIGGGKPDNDPCDCVVTELVGNWVKLIKHEKVDIEKNKKDTCPRFCSPGGGCSSYLNLSSLPPACKAMETEE